MTELRPNPLDIHEALIKEFTLYYNAAFGLRNESLMRERTELIHSEVGFSQEPLLEPIFPIAPDTTIAKVCQTLGLTPEVSD